MRVVLMFLDLTKYEVDADSVEDLRGIISNLTGVDPFKLKFFGGGVILSNKTGSLSRNSVKPGDKVTIHHNMKKSTGGGGGGGGRIGAGIHDHAKFEGIHDHAKHDGDFGPVYDGPPPTKEEMENAMSIMGMMGGAAISFAGQAQATLAPQPAQMGMGMGMGMPQFPGGQAPSAGLGFGAGSGSGFGQPQAGPMGNMGKGMMGMGMGMGMPGFPTQASTQPMTPNQMMGLLNTPTSTIQDRVMSGQKPF